MKYLRISVALIFNLWFNSQIIAQNTIVIRDNSLQANQTYNWTKNNLYILDGMVFLESGGRLNIEAGTVIKARRQPSASTGSTTSGLVIAKGAKIYANGTEENPIVFTVEGDNLSKPNDFKKSDKSLWYGIAVLGKGIISIVPGSSGGFSAHLPSNGPAPFPSESFNDDRTYFGGNNDADNSGNLSFVSIRHSKAGLYLAGLGSSTVIDHVEVFAAKDGIKIWGGKVNAKYVAAHFISHNAYSLAYGWRGMGMHWTSVQEKNATGSAVALDGHEPFEYSGIIYDIFFPPEGPGRFTKPTIYHGTFVGGGSNASGNNFPVALSFVNNAAGTIGNSIFVDFPGKALYVNDSNIWPELDSYTRLIEGDLKLPSNVWSRFGGGSQLNATAAGIIKTTGNLYPGAPALVSHLNNNKNLILPSILMESRPNYSTTLLDVRLQKEEEGLLLQKVTPLPSNSFFMTTVYPPESRNFCPLQGATFAEYGWLSGWTAIFHNKLLYDKPYVEYNERYYQFEDVQINCSEFDAFSKTYKMYYPEFSCGPYFYDLGLAANRRTRGAKSSKTDQLDTFCITKKEIDFDYYKPNKCIDYRICAGKWVPGTIILTVIADNCPPKVRIVPYPTDDVPSNWQHSFYLEIEDVSQTWIRSETVNNAYYEWIVEDYCKNKTVFRLYRNLFGTYRNWYADVDGDGYGDPNVVFSWTSRPPGYVSNAGDCDDNNPEVNPAQSENPRTIEDDDCSGCAAGPLEIYTEDILTLAPTIIQVDGKVTSSAVVLDQQQITFRSDKEIVLSKGFTAQAGSKFTAQIRPCPNNFDDESAVKPRADSITVFDSNETEPSLNVYPNPVTDQFTIAIQLPQKTPVSLSLFDIQGRKLQQIISGTEMKGGVHRVQASRGEWSEGMYYLELKTDKQTIVEKVLFLSNH